jgi:hypothetical protein
MQAANTAAQSPRLHPRTLALAAVIALLGAVVAYALVHELRKSAPAGPAAAPNAFIDQRPALTADEERFAQGLWKVHSEVRTAAVRMTFAGLAYKTGDADRASIKTKVAPLTPLFRQAEGEVRALNAPSSLQDSREQYLQALRLYSSASQEMVKIAQDGKDEHLLKAQEMSEKASGLLLQVSEKLWPGEHKPN